MQLLGHFARYVMRGPYRIPRREFNLVSGIQEGRRALWLSGHCVQYTVTVEPGAAVAVSFAGALPMTPPSLHPLPADKVP